MRFVSRSGRARIAQASLGAVTTLGLWAASLGFAAAPALAAEFPKEAAVAGPSGLFAPVQAATNTDGFRPVPSAGDNGAATAIAAADSPASVRANAGKAAEVAGRYAILRKGGKDTGCMLTLDDKAHGPRGSFKAILSPGCGDQGLLIFDPVGWEIASSRLSLVARKGHQTHLEQQSDGTWIKDPREGPPPLELKKM